MPKVFLTGSGASKGYVTGSGYLNNPYKIVTGDVSRRRVYAWIWQGGFTLSNYFDFQFMTLRQ